MSAISRCQWVNDDPIYIAYHDTEWGKPVYDDRTLFELLILEGMQAGLSWITILKKREHYRRVFLNFDAQRIALFTDQDVERLVQDPGIVRHRLKIQAILNNARRYLEVCEEWGGFKEYIWQFVEGVPQCNHWQTLDQVPVSTPESDRLSQDLKKRGFKFVGTTICYAYMQAVGMVNDHVVSCFLYKR